MRIFCMCLRRHLYHITFLNNLGNSNNTILFSEMKCPKGKSRNYPSNIQTDMEILGF